jgi:hypothetical protein
MLKSRELLEQNLIKPTLEVKRRRGVVKDIKNYLADKYSIFDGSIQSWITNPDELKGIDDRLLCLFTEQIYQKTGDPNINPEEFYTATEIKSARQFSGKLLIEDEVKFPLHFEYALQNSRDAWVVMMDIKTVVGLLKSRKLHWNPEAQREATRKVVNGQIVEEATVYMENVHEMKKLLKEHKLEQTQLIFNVVLGTAGDELDEVVYDKNTHELTVNDGVINITDGYHRILAAQMALAEQPNIDFQFEVKILNMTVPRSAEYLAQISKGQKISEVKRRSMSKETNADIIVNDLQTKSVLRDKISKKEGLSANELVTYNTLVKSIEKNFSLDKTIDRVEVSEYLQEFFEILFAYHEDEFINNFPESKKSSMLVENLTFGGFISLAAKMREKGISPSKINNYLRNIDFSKDNNTLWIELDILDSKKRLTRNAKSGIEKLFSEIEV